MTQENMLARYKILHELGRGATGAVYAANDRTTGALVALKRLDPALFQSDSSLADRFLKHARSARSLIHRNIVRVHEAGQAAGTAYVAMEMLEGENLRRILDRGPLRVTRAIQIAHDVASGLAHAHLQGVLHGGIKPSNVIVLRSGAAKITDFGIGQLVQPGLLSGALADCLGYMSPEQLRGGPLDHRSDVFSLGALFYEMLAQRRPFQGGSAKDLVEKMLRAAPPPPSELNPHSPRVLDAIVLSMLAGQPAQRMPGVPVLVRELQRLEQGLGLESDASAGSDAPKASVPPAAPPPKPRTPEPELRRPQAQPRTPEPRPRAPEPEGLHDRVRDAARFDQHADREAFDYQKARLMMDRDQRSSGSRPAALGAVVVVLAVLGGTGFLYYSYSSGPSKPSFAASRTQESRAQEAPAAARRKAPARAPEEPASEEPASAGVGPTQPVPRAEQPTEQLPERQPGTTARLILAVSPQGEVFIDGKHLGSTPPMTTFELEPGEHRIEVRSGARTPYVTYLTVEAGDVRRIRHDFNAKVSRPTK